MARHLYVLIAALLVEHRRHRLWRVLLHQPREAARQHLAHHPIVVARRQIGALDIELAILVFDEALGPRDDERTDRVRPLDVAIVVDLDPLRRMVEIEHLGDALKQPRLARAVGDAPRQRLARIHDRLSHHLALLAALRCQHLDAPLGLQAQRLLEQRALRNVVAQEQLLGRIAVVVELRQERVEHLDHFDAFVVLRKIRTVAPILSRAEEEHLDAGLSAFLMRGEKISLVDRVRIDTLIELDMRERANAIAQPRRLFEIERFGRKLHFL